MNTELVRAWWRAQFVVQREERGVSTLGKRFANVLNLELSTFFKGETAYKSEFKEQYLAMDDDPSIPPEDSKPSGKTTSLEQSTFDSILTAFMERQQGTEFHMPSDKELSGILPFLSRILISRR